VRIVQAGGNPVYTQAFCTKVSATVVLQLRDRNMGMIRLIHRPERIQTLSDGNQIRHGNDTRVLVTWVSEFGVVAFGYIDGEDLVGDRCLLPLLLFFLGAAMGRDFTMASLPKLDRD
jgi:hypothetical protein